MSDSFSFQFHAPEPPPQGGKFVTAKQAEELLLGQLQTKERAEPEVLWDLACLYSKTGNQERAFALVQQLVEKANSLEEKARFCLAMGQLMEQMGNYEMAVRYYREALALEPVGGGTWYFINNNLGYCLNHFQRFAEAEPYLRRAIEIDPNRANAFKNLGISLQGQGDYAGAAQCYIKAVRVNAADPRALRHLEQLLQQHPAVSIELPDVGEQLAACQLACRLATNACNDALRQWQQNGKPS
jgi:tetratricopeptide (TPR) repeat protein